jgi:hypothetical protein
MATASIRRALRKCPLMACGSVTLLAALLIAAAAASADWRSVTGVPSRPVNVISVTPQGNVVAYIPLSCNQPAPSTATVPQIKVMSPVDGHEIWSLTEADAHPYNLSSCGDGPELFDAQDNLYAPGYPKGSPPGTYYLVSYSPTGAFRWASPLDGQLGFNNRIVNDSVIGADGNVYVYDTTLHHLQAFRSNDGTKRWDVQVQAGAEEHGLSADATGLTVAGTIRYDYSGNLLHAEPPSGDTTGWGIAQAPGGISYTASTGNSQWGTCEQTGDYSIKVSQWTLAGIKWTKSVHGPTKPATFLECVDAAEWIKVKALPAGGVLVGATDAVDTPNQKTYLIALNKAGHVLWTRTINRGWSGEVFSGMRVSQSGEIVTAQYGREPCLTNTWEACAAVGVDFFSAATGQPTRSAVVIHDTDETTEASTQEPVDQGGAEEGVAVGEDTVYLPLQIDGTPQVVAVSEPGLLSDYEDQLRAQPSPTSSPNYVALGDSYSSGEGNPPYEPGTDIKSLDECHRSEAAYPLQLAVQLGMKLKFRACSGAITDDIISPNPANGEPPQLSWLTSGTKIVTLTIGGDDAGFTEIMNRCVAGPRTSWPFHEDFGCAEDGALNSHAATALAALAGKGSGWVQGRPIHSIRSVIEAIHDKAKSARIVVGGYPLLFGPSQSTYTLFLAAPSHFVCAVGVPPFSVDYDDAKWINERGIELDSVIAGAVTAAHAQEHIPVKYAPATTPFRHHGLCDKEDAWIHPLELDGLSGPKKSSFHPTQDGQALGYVAAFSKKL